MYVVGSGRRVWRVDERIWFRLYQSCGNKGSVGRGWYTTSRKIELPPPPLARVEGVGRQQHHHQG